MSAVIVITSGKGGTGKTSLTSGVASCLAALGHPTLCIDMDVGLRNLDISLGVSDRALMDFTDVLEGRCSLERAAVEHPVIHGLHLLTAPVQLPRTPPSAEAIEGLLRQARERFSYILIDSPAGLGPGFQLAAWGADRAVVVSTNDSSALRDAQRTVAELGRRMETIHQLHLDVQKNQVNGRIVFLDQLHAVIIRGDFYIPPGLPAVLVQQAGQILNEVLFVITNCQMQHWLTCFRCTCL